MFNIKVIKEDLGDVSIECGGEYAENDLKIRIDKKLTPRQQTARIIHAILENYLPSAPHEKIEELEGLIIDGLDQL